MMKPFRLILYILSIAFLGGCAIIQPVRKAPYALFTQEIAHQPFDAIIVPGVPYYGESWSRTMEVRVLWSKFLYDKGYAKNIIYSGGAVYSPYVESKIMALYAEKLGIPKEHLFTEERAEHSTENVYYSYYYAKELGFSNIALASDPYQVNNLRKYIQKYNLPYRLLPVLYDTIVVLDNAEPTILANTARKDTLDFVPLPERESFFKRLKGTLGKNIKYSEEDEERKKGKKQQE